MCIVYTAQMRYGGADKMDITIKGDSPFGPTWTMVRGVKDYSMTEKEYTELYYELMRTLYTEKKHLFEEVCSKETVTFCCYCRPGSFCHRYMLADMFVKLGCTYGGER